MPASTLDQRLLGDEDRREPHPTFQVAYTVCILVLMFAVLITDKVGADSVMLTALTLFYIANIISIKEAIAGFSSQGLLTVLVLFVVAEGLNKTGALNWYVAKLLGRPKTLSGAQLRVMVPIAMLSGFINDTPLVTLSLPIVRQWSRKIGVHPRFLLMPLSFAALLGGVCTLIGTSTNLVISGLLQDNEERYGKVQISLFELGQYGVPVAMTGIAYVILATPFLLARKKHDTTQLVLEDAGELLLGAEITPFSPAAGRTIQRSGLRNTGGIYLVRVQRQETGRVHHAVGPDFVLAVGDILFFTGVVETFADFCALHGLQVVTNEVQQREHEEGTSSELSGLLDLPLQGMPTIPEEGNSIGYTLASLLDASAGDRIRVIYQMEDAIRGEFSVTNAALSDRSRVIVSVDRNLVVVAIDTLDRSGLLLDISKCLAELNLELRHTEAAVRNNRSLSIWRCAQSDIDEKELWSAVQALLARDSGVQAVKQRGLRVVRARVRSQGRLVGTIANAEFRNTYKAAIVAIQKGGKSVTESLSNTIFDAGDLLVLQAEADSPLLVSPPEDFYAKLNEADSENVRATKLIGGFFRSRSTEHMNEKPSNDMDLAEQGHNEADDVIKEREAVWKDLEVIVSGSTADIAPSSREFLTAMKVEPSSKLIGVTVAQGGIDKLPDLFLVSIERPVQIPDVGSDVSSNSAIPLSEKLQAGDILWFSGTAFSIGDLRKIPGLVSFESDEVDKMNAKVYDRRLVQAVVALKGPLVGKTVKDVRFRTQYGAAVIAVQREGERVHEHPGNIKLQAGDVLLLEAGPSFMDNKVEHDRSFILVSEVKDSAPPRLRMLIPAIILTVGAYGCYMAKLAELWGCGMVAAILMVAFGIISEQEARDAIKWDIFTTIGSAFGIGTALVNSGVAGGVAKFLVKIGDAIGLGNAGLLGSVYLSTVLISQVVANNAAAALIFPIAMDAALSTGTDAKLMAFTIMLAASAAFMTPFGYQTNLMVMGFGGYKTTDFLVFGTPMQIVLLIASTIYLVSPFWICWLVTFALFAAASAFRIISDLNKDKRKLS